MEHVLDQGCSIGLVVDKEVLVTVNSPHDEPNLPPRSNQATESVPHAYYSILYNRDIIWLSHASSPNPPPNPPPPDAHQ